MKKCPFIVAKGFIDCIGADCALWGMDTCGLKYIPLESARDYPRAEMTASSVVTVTIPKEQKVLLKEKNDRPRNQGTSKEGGKARTGKRQVKGNRS